MQLTILTRVVLCLFLVSLWLATLSAKREMKKVKGFAKLAPKSAKQAANKRQVTLDIMGKKETVAVKKQKVSLGQKYKDVSVFASKDKKLTCMEKCPKSETGEVCTTRCMKQAKEGYTYLTEDKALEVTNDEEEFFMDMANTAPLNSSSFDNTSHPRRRREATEILQPNFGTVGVVNMKYIADAAFMRIFQELTDGSVSSAKNEARQFLLLTTVRVALYYGTLKDYGVSFKTSDGVTRLLDLTVYMDSVDFPYESGNSFYDIPAVLDNTDGDLLLVKLYYNSYGQFLYFGGALAGLAYHARSAYQGSRQLDLVALATGLNLETREYIDYNPSQTTSGVVGIAFLQQFCMNYQNTPYDLRISINEVFASYFPRVFAHEIGHNLGAFHDDSTSCPKEFLTVMSPTAYPRIQGFTNYNKFSKCSADSIATHLSRFTNNDLVQCLYSQSPTESEFLNQFCTGVLGDRYDLDKQCKIFFGPYSSLCSFGYADLENGYLPKDMCEAPVYQNYYYPVFYCSYFGSCSSYVYPVYHPFDGTKCLNDDYTRGTKVCYNGACVDKINLCNP